ncbi:hypothetical protein AVEN_41732-1 [Araneus ventricosus]|uniref:Uncharacterized protein n=1 Tax=Araneus ventricosus TaxID=182803 RepID=A0A4Y2ABU1_ARAVE|nr:hypothetical protein AVEN_41732-1 [Araneus ventricosus]
MDPWVIFCVTKQHLSHLKGLCRSPQILGSSFEGTNATFFGTAMQTSGGAEYVPSGSAPNSARPSPRVRPPTEKSIGERFMVKEKSAASVSTRTWTPERRSLTLSIAFML